MRRVREWLKVPEVSGRVAAGLALLRVTAGCIMAMHGYGKIKNPLHWMDGAPNPPAAVLQLIAAVSEFFGGLAIAAGLLSPLAAIGIVCTMGYAIYTHKLKGDPLVGKGGGSYELAALHLLAALTILITGPGKLSVDRLLFGAKKR